MATTFIHNAQRLTLLAMVTLLPLIAMAQGQIHYDHKARIKNEQTELLLVRTISCLRTSTLALLQNRVTDRDEVMAFNLKFCGKPLYEHLTVTMKWESRDAAELLLDLSDRTVASLQTR